MEFTPPKGFHGLLVLHMDVEVPSGYSACDITVVVNPGNDPPRVPGAWRTIWSILSAVGRVEAISECFT